MTVKELREWLKDKNGKSILWFVRDGRELQYTDIGVIFVEDEKDYEPDLFEGEL